MKIVTVMSLAPLFAACSVHDRFREPPHAAKPAVATSSPRVAGVVRGDDGEPARAAVAAVGPGGSASIGTDADGRFELHTLWWPEFVLHASTTDGRFATVHARDGARGVELVLQRGGTLAIALDGTDRARCAIFAGDVLVQDFTLCAGKTMPVVLPAGDVRVRLYDGDRTLAEARARVVLGESHTVRLSPKH